MGKLLTGAKDFGWFMVMVLLALIVAVFILHWASNQFSGNFVGNAASTITTDAGLS